jgi:hypothetical protein
MHTPSTSSRVLFAFILLTFSSVVGAFAFGSVARSQVVEPEARPTPVFGRLAVSPPNLTFALLNYDLKKGRPASESKFLTIENTGHASSTLMVNVGPITGTGQSSFFITPPPGLYPILPGKAAAQRFLVTFMPISDGRVTAQIMISSSDASGQRGVTGRIVNLVGNARGPIPTPSITPTPTPTPTPLMSATPTPTPTGSVSPTPTATPTASPSSTPLAQGAGTVSKNSANAPGVIITGDTVTAYVPLATDSFAGAGLNQAVIENGTNPLPGAAGYTANRVNSCTPASSGEVVCSEGNALGTAQFDLIPAGASTAAVTSIATSSTGAINYLPGECSGCGMLVDGGLGTGGAGLGIMAASNGFFTLDLGNIANTPAGPITTNPSELPGANFGYDAIHHRILNANYSVTSFSPLTTTPPHFQIIDITNVASPLVYDLNNDQTFFVPGTPGTTCTGNSKTDNDNQYPETTAFDDGNNVDIAYVTFHTPPDCQNTPANTLALFDMTQATFTPGTAGASGTWDTTGKQIQALTDFSVNGVDPISIEPNNHVAIVSGGSTPFGALQLPTTSGTGTPAITDWVSANMPNDPDGTPWNGWSLPNGLATYVSPNTGKPMGLMLNSLEDISGNRTGLARYAALVDINALLALPRDQVGGHQVLSSSDGQALVTAKVVTFVLVK